MRLSDEKSNELHRFIYEYPTKRKEGFLPNELEWVLEKYLILYPNFSMDKYNDAMMGNTCGMYEGKYVIYQTDVFKAILVGIEERDLTFGEWD